MTSASLELQYVIRQVWRGGALLCVAVFRMFCLAVDWLSATMV